MTRSRTGGTDSPRYCYSVWLRHLTRARDAGINIAQGHLVEFGPGDSIGVGIAAYLSGVERYTALDMIPYATSNPDPRLIDEIAELYASESEIPDDDEFPDIWPKLDSYDFPEGLPDPVTIGRRAHRLRVPSLFDLHIRYIAPWDGTTLQINHVDTVLSQAVMEHVDDLVRTHRWLAGLLADGGFASHTIDFRAHATSDLWYGHLVYPDFVWRLTRGRREFLLNRQPMSAHVDLMQRHGLKVADVQVDRGEIDRWVDIQPRFAGWSRLDLTTRIAYIGAVKRVPQ